MRIKGKAHKFGDNIDTDVIIPARYLVSTDAKALAAHCMEPADPEFPKQTRPGDIMVAGKNFGSGSSREHAVVAIQGAGICLVIAKSFARIFYRNAFNRGLPLLESAEAAKDAQPGDLLEAELESGTIKNRTNGHEYHAEPIPEFMLALLKDGGLGPHLKKRAGASGRTVASRRRGR